MNTIVIATGGFDPLHSGHIKYLEAARQLGDRLIIGLNSDAWLTRKKGRSFMPFLERQAVLKGLSCTGYVIGFDDSDNSAKNVIHMVRQSYPQDKIIFVNGGDRTKDNIPEMDIQDNNLEFVFGVGGENKRNSSSWILEEWKNPKTFRDWGYYRVLDSQPGTKTKELVVNPQCSLSMQRHFKRSEYWHIVSGVGCVDLETENNFKSVYLYPHSFINIAVGTWHKLRNTSQDIPLKVIEIQFGEDCIEEDIERKV